MSLALIALTILLVVANGFFVAAEFALVKVRPSRLLEMVRQGAPFASSAQWLASRMNNALSACQLGITMASLGLGWVGEPAIARLLHPLFGLAGIESEAVIHTVSFIIAFTLITAAHLIVGEQAPKIFAIREPERMVRWCAIPLIVFYLLSYPLLVGLSVATSALLRVVGVDADAEHDAPHSEAEIRALVSRAHTHGELSRSERSLIDAVFEFDDTICRRIMVPRVEIEFMDVGTPFDQLLATARQSRHTRYPLCEGDLDRTIGVVHIKDLLGVGPDETVDLRTVMRPPRYVPETLRISKLLRHFQATRQHLAMVLDEYGTTVGLVTMENVLERIVGSVEDEFDAETPDIVPDGPQRFIVQAGAPLGAINRSLELALVSSDVDSIGGLVMEKLGRVLSTGDTVTLDGVDAEVLEARDSRAVRLRLTLPKPEEEKETVT